MHTIAKTGNVCSKMLPKRQHLGFHEFRTSENVAKKATKTENRWETCSICCQKGNIYRPGNHRVKKTCEGEPKNAHSHKNPVFPPSGMDRATLKTCKAGPKKALEKYLVMSCKPRYEENNKKKPRYSPKKNGLLPIVSMKVQDRH